MMITVNSIQKNITQTNRQEGIEIQKKRKAAKICILLFSALLVCFIPKGAYDIFVAFNVREYSAVNWYISNWLATLASTNALWDSLIYAWRLQKVRSELLKWLGWKKNIVGVDTSLNTTSTRVISDVKYN